MVGCEHGKVIATETMLMLVTSQRAQPGDDFGDGHGLLHFDMDNAGYGCLDDAVDLVCETERLYQASLNFTGSMYIESPGGNAPEFGDLRNFIAVKAYSETRISLKLPWHKLHHSSIHFLEERFGIQP